MNGASDDSSNLSGMVRSIRKAKNYGGNNKSEGYTNMVDLGELFKSACGDSEAQAVMDALNDAVVYTFTAMMNTAPTDFQHIIPSVLKAHRSLISSRISA